MKKIAEVCISVYDDGTFGVSNEPMSQDAAENESDQNEAKVDSVKSALSMARQMLGEVSGETETPMENKGEISSIEKAKAKPMTMTMR
jgi:hypothetical protein